MKIYCQYNYGGYKTFYLEGQDEELLDKEVTTSSSFNFPQEARAFFRYGGIKFAYFTLSDGSYLIAVRDIVSLHNDSMGRHTQCAVLFIGDSNERDIMNALALRMTSNINSFDSFFAKLFYINDGLRCNSSVLLKYVYSAKEQKPNSKNLPQELRDMDTAQRKVLFLIPTSESFGKDDVVTRNVLDDYKILERDIRGHYVHITQLRDSIQEDEGGNNENGTWVSLYKKYRKTIILGVILMSLLIICTSKCSSCSRDKNQEEIHNIR